MRKARVQLAGMMAGALVGVLIASAPAAAQTAANRTVPRTAWGAPDLQGVWSGATVTPLQRPQGAAEFLTDAEIQEIEHRAILAATDEARGETPQRDVSGAYNDFWWDRGTRVSGTKRTSIIFDPKDGRMPAFTPEMQKYADSPEAARRQQTRGGNFPAASWEDTDLWDRCLTRGLPIVPGPYNNNYQIFQTPTHVVILHEMIHDSRIIPLDNSPHLPSSITQWVGDARGRWEGDTLVVDSTNFTPKQEYPFDPRTSSGGMHLTERFTRVDDGTLLYQFTVEDPTTYSRPWSGEIAMPKTDGRLYEYACHEGNYGIVGILSGSRETERRAAEAARKGSR